LSALATLMARLWSSLRIVPVALAVLMVAPPVAPDSDTVNVSSGSTAVSPATLTVSSLLVSVGADVTVPLGKVPPVKSAASHGVGPGSGHRPVDAGRAAAVATARQDKGERCGAAVALGLVGGRGGDGQVGRRDSQIPREGEIVAPVAEVWILAVTRDHDFAVG